MTPTTDISPNKYPVNEHWQYDASKGRYIYNKGEFEVTKDEVEREWSRHRGFGTQTYEVHTVAILERLRKEWEKNEHPNGLGLSTPPELENEPIRILISEVKGLLAAVEGLMFIYEHHFKGEEALCENCHEVVKNNTPCMNSRQLHHLG